MSDPPDEFWGMTGSVLKRADALERQKKEAPKPVVKETTPPQENVDASALSAPKLTKEGHTLHKLALLYHGQGKSEEAERLYQKALVLLEEAPGRNKAEEVSLLNNLGRLYFEQKMYAEAERLFGRSLEMAQEVYGEEHPKVARRLINLAELSFAIGRHSEADSLYQRALTIEEKQLGIRHPDTAKTARAYIAMLKKMNSLARAGAIAACFYVLRRGQERRVPAARRVADRRHLGRPAARDRRQRAERRQAIGRRSSALTPAPR